MISKNHLIYYLDIIPVIQFLISHWPFAPHLAYVLVSCYLTDNPEKFRLDNKEKQIYEEMYIADLWWTI